MKTFYAAAFAFALTAGVAQATTYDFRAPSVSGHHPSIMNTYTDGILTVTPTADGILNWDGSVSQSKWGLGVYGAADIQPGEIDGFPLFSSEALTFTFSKAVKLFNVVLSRLDQNDDYNLYIDGDLVGKYGLSDGNPLEVGKRLTSFTIEAVGELESCGFFCNVDGLGNDSFAVESITASPVPLPAGGLLLVGGMAALASVKRRKKS